MNDIVPASASLSRFPSRKLAVLLVLIFANLIQLALLIRHPQVSSPQSFKTLAAFTVAQEEVKPGLPVRLRIPRIGVDAVIGPVGLTAEGDLGTPTSPVSTGWYNGGPRPGEVGSSVIDGHYGMANDKPAVFDSLNALQVGDKIQVEDEKGVVTTFIVTGSRLYSTEEDATAVFRTSDGKARLNLITCQGVWNAGQSNYETRLVVFSVRE